MGRKPGSRRSEEEEMPDVDTVRERLAEEIGDAAAGKVVAAFRRWEREIYSWDEINALDDTPRVPKG